MALIKRLFVLGLLLVSAYRIEVLEEQVAELEENEVLGNIYETPELVEGL